jgi:hypothetical protein
MKASPVCGLFCASAMKLLNQSAAISSVSVSSISSFCVAWDAAPRKARRVGQALRERSVQCCSAALAARAWQQQCSGARARAGATRARLRERGCRLHEPQKRNRIALRSVAPARSACA